MTPGGALDALLANGKNQKFSVHVHAKDLDDTSLAAEAEDVLREMVARVVRHYVPSVEEVDVDLSETLDSASSSPSDADFDFVIDAPPLETLDPSLYFLCPFVPNKQGVLVKGNLFEGVKRNCGTDPNKLCLSDALQMVKDSGKKFYAVKKTQHYQALTKENKIGVAIYPIGGYDEIPAKLDDGAVFADFFRLWKLQRALPDLHLYEIDDEIRNRYLFRPPLVYVPAGPAETDRGNGALARAFGAATEELLRGNWDASGYPFWTLGKSYFYEGTDKKQRDPLLRTYAEQTKLSFGEAAQAEAG